MTTLPVVNKRYEVSTSAVKYYSERSSDEAYKSVTWASNVPH